MAGHLSKSGAHPVRTFLAIQLPPEVLTQLASIGPQFGSQAHLCRWVQPRHLHITLRFLGAVEPHLLEEVMAVSDMAASVCAPCTLHLDALGAFPSRRSPRVLWMGLRKDSGLKDLQLLHTELDRGLVGLGLAPDDKVYLPHITLGRLRNGVSSEDIRGLGEALERVDQTLDMVAVIHVREVVTMRSDLSPQGPHYSLLHTSILQGGSEPRVTM